MGRNSTVKPFKYIVSGLLKMDVNERTYTREFTKIYMLGFGRSFV